MNKLVLIDGAKGHTGTFLIEEILKTKPNWRIIATDLPSEKRDEIMTKETVFSGRFKYKTDILEDKKVTFIPADLTDKESLKRVYNNQNFVH